jgi:hypothetical protein
MKQLIFWIPRAVVLMGLASQAYSQVSPPDQAFQTVHLTVSINPDAEKILMAAISDLNNAITKAGCPSCIYHLSKAYGEKPGPFPYMWIANWPDRATYEKIHASDAYNAAWNKHPELAPVRKGEIYTRYVEVTPGK